MQEFTKCEKCGHDGFIVGDRFRDLKCSHCDEPMTIAVGVDWLNNNKDKNESK